MENVKELPEFSSDQDIAAFMEAYDSFELVDRGLAEIVETPKFHRKGYVALASETITLLDDLVAAGVCTDMENAINQAIHSYALAVLPEAYKLVRKERLSPVAPN